MRLIVARCEVSYTGRLSARLAEGVRLLMIKEDGTVMLWSDGGGLSVKPLNWMTPPTVIEDSGDLVVVRKRAGRTEDRLEIKLVEVLSDVVHDMGEAAGLEKDGVERDLQLLLGVLLGRWSPARSRAPHRARRRKASRARAGRARSPRRRCQLRSRIAVAFASASPTSRSTSRSIVSSVEGPTEPRSWSEAPRNTSPPFSPIVTGPSAWDMPNEVTIVRARLVAACRSSLTPLDRWPKAIRSPAVPDTITVS